MHGKRARESRALYAVHKEILRTDGIFSGKRVYGIIAKRASNLELLVLNFAVRTALSRTEIESRTVPYGREFCRTDG